MMDIEFWIFFENQEHNGLSKYLVIETDIAGAIIWVDHFSQWNKPFPCLVGVIGSKIALLVVDPLGPDPFCKGIVLSFTTGTLEVCSVKIF